MFRRDYFLEAQEGEWDLEEVWERCVATKEKNGPTVFYSLDSSYSPPKVFETEKEKNKETSTH